LRGATLRRRQGHRARAHHQARHESASRDALLAAIAKARGWIEDLKLSRVALAEIAKHESLGERHIRLLASLAFVAPRLVGAITDGDAPADLSVTGLAKALPYSWAEQEQRSAARGP
jgi:site-specific DNA recombinase